MPSILLVNRVFPPDRGATGRCLADLAGRLAALGWRVTVVADGAAGADVETPPGVTLHRAGRGVPEGSGPDALSYLGALRRLAWRALRLPRHDVVVTMTDPPLSACLGPLLAARHRAAAIHWSQDVYPALLPQVGVRLPPPLFALLDGVMATALRRHDAVVAIGRCMARRLAGAGVAGERVTVLPNWPDPLVRPLAKEPNRVRAGLGLEGRFVVAYSGNLGLAHPMGGVLKAAALLRDDPSVRFLVVGEGRGHAAFTEAVRSRGLANVAVLPWQPADRLAESLSAADLHLAVMAGPAEGLMVPSKLASAMAAGRPCLFLGPEGSEAARRLDGCGGVLAAGDGAGLAEAIRAYAADPARCAAEGAKAAAVAASWTADHAALRFSALAEALLERRRGRMGAPAWQRLPYA
ncbi:glycosyltransferase involved in cell wall biosynthesis [Azospirillum agricola]|uniref:glycosyltransferase family 4 protein n=1 Tax=Azospirillum agricola TaxID=1720247 RepID=UPI001AE806C3|nr:glycosyltransferase family 4 protein [Azospirillum agricola]MBP2226929.1 glycosyltransferase involved in cell wall biosynthesis [Azospirillum agricola]